MSFFPAYSERNSLLIPENRLFITAGVEVIGNQTIRGIKTIPDALLIVYNKNLTKPVQINLIEYECFGESRVRVLEKSNYLNGQIIPQLMKFASSFSIVTDRQIRERTIRLWIDKIVEFIFRDQETKDKCTSWINEIHPELPEELIGLEIDRIVSEAFRTNLKIILIVDELSAAHKDTITNVIKAFRLENGESINFLAYVVRLEQKISLTDAEAEFALSVQ